jgi:hypothetical protein
MAGQWLSELEHGRNRVVYDFFFDQEFQFVEGMARVGAREGKIPEFKLVGDQVDFTTRVVVEGKVMPHRFLGKVKSETIEGSVTFGEGKTQRTQPWLARLIKTKDVSYGGDRPPRYYRRQAQ